MPKEKEKIEESEPPKFEVEVEKEGLPVEKEVVKEDEVVEQKVEEPLVVSSESEIKEPSAVSVEAEEEKPRTKKTFLFILLIILILVAVAGGIFVYKKSIDKKNSSSGPTPTATPPAEQITETPVVELKRGDLKVEILNGSGTPGAAGVAQKYLEDLGYLIAKTGNAKSFTYKTTEISIKEEKRPYLEMLVKDLGEKYTLATGSSFLGSENEFDAVIVVGKK